MSQGEIERANARVAAVIRVWAITLQSGGRWFAVNQAAICLVFVVIGRLLAETMTLHAVC